MNSCAKASSKSKSGKKACARGRSEGAERGGGARDRCAREGAEQVSERMRGNFREHVREGGPSIASCDRWWGISIVIT